MVLDGFLVSSFVGLREHCLVSEFFLIIDNNSTHIFHSPVANFCWSWWF